MIDFHFRGVRAESKGPAHYVMMEIVRTLSQAVNRGQSETIFKIASKVLTIVPSAPPVVTFPHHDVESFFEISLGGD